MKIKIALLPGLILVGVLWAKPLPTPLFLRGYVLIPTPQQVQLENGEIELDSSWAYEAGVATDHIAVRTLLKDLREFHGIEAQPVLGSSPGLIRLAVSEGTVKTGADAEIESQAYRLRIAPGQIEITGNADAGLFYGVQTLLQLLKPTAGGSRLLPVCTIEDWPRYQLRFLHWDTKHHQDRIETLKRYLDWSARFKVNMIGFELEDKFEYPSHPVIGAPGAFTTEQLQEVVDYGLERYIQVVPQIQSPAHLAYVLKHPEFAHLRADGNNYQACLCQEETYDLIFSMYQDVIRATRGVEYFHVSTDEVYYAGICAKCEKPYNEENRSLQWVEFVRRAHQFLRGQGRKMLVWAEYPLLAQHIGLLPADIIDGVLGRDPEFIQAENEHGMRQLVYTSMQGSEFLFPNHLPYKSEQGVTRGRLHSAFEALSFEAQQGNPIGVYGAAWDDSGLHNETFWLGWATVAQYGWTPGTPSVEQTVAEFMQIYYGGQVSGMVEIYRGLQEQARFFRRSWDRVVSRVRGPGYGNSYGKGFGTTRYDYTLPRPALPSLPGLDFTPVYVGRYGELVEEAARMAYENDALVQRIVENVGLVQRNRYNLEVLLSLAEFTGHHHRMILTMKEIEESLSAARRAAERNQPKEALKQLLGAYERARGIVEERDETFRYLETIWEKSRYPKGREVNGKKFYHVLDDTKDHRADRRVDLTYLIAPEQSIGLEEWMKSLVSIMKEYANKRKLRVPELKEATLLC